MLIIGAPLSGWGQDAKGFMIADSCGPYDAHLHLVSIPNQPQGQELVLSLRSLAGPLNVTDWDNVAAKSCSNASGCVAARSGKVQVLHDSKAQMSGNFQVVLTNGSIIEGTFAKKRKARHGQEPRCE